MRSARRHRWILPLAVATAFLALPSAPAEATPAACVDNCTILAAFPGYVAPVAEIASGASVIWSSVDSSHPTGEQTTFAGGGTPCFLAGTGPGSPSQPVDFAITGDGVTATSAGFGTVLCASAIALGDIGFVLPYACKIHPWMQAALLITP